MKRALLISLLIHAGVFGLWEGGGHAPGGASGVLRVALVDAHDSGQVAAEAVARARAASSTPRPEDPSEAALPSADAARVVPPTAPVQPPDPPPLRRQVAAPAEPATRPATSPAVPLPAAQPGPEPVRGAAPAHERMPPAPASAIAAAPARPPAAADPPHATTAPPPPGRGAGAGREQGVQGGRAADLRAAVESQLRESVFPRFAYPGLARRRGWEGIVRVALTVEPDGRLRNVRLLKTSGFKVLDRAALRDLREVSEVPGVAASLGGKDLDVVLPVHYRLDGG